VTKAQSAKAEAARRAVIKRQELKIDKEVYKPSPDDQAEEESDDEKPSPKRKRVSEQGVTSLLRRSSRSSRPVSRLGDELARENSTFDDDLDSPASGKGSKRNSYSGELQRNAKRLGVRTQNPKRFGHIPGVEVGRCWATRMECSTDAIHAYVSWLRREEAVTMY
jgi:E3 ubiquitin-protein ligase UHRF1